MNLLPEPRNLSWMAARISLHRRSANGDQGPTSSGTGCFWLHEGRLNLITNWHNVTGYNPITLKPLSDMGFTPNSLTCIVALKIVADTKEFCRWVPVDVDLFDADQNPAWREHPEHGRNVDVIALEIGEMGERQLFSAPINAYSEFVDFAPMAGDDAFVLGYPKGLTGGLEFPIWKRASIASEPQFEVDGLPKILIDTATRKGMSGSPVVAVRSGIIRPRGVGPSTGLTGEDILGTAENLLGIYSGRVDDDQFGAQIGVVWKAAVVEDIVVRGTPGREPYG